MWIAQDENGDIYQHADKPYKDSGQWGSWGDIDLLYEGNKNQNWKKSRINLDKHDYEIIDGILTKKEKTMRHKHADLMIALANDASLTIEVRSSNNGWSEIENPAFFESNEYRIKPKTRKQYVRIAVFKNHEGVEYTFKAQWGDKDSVKIIEKEPGFVRWASDWIEVELNG